MESIGNIIKNFKHWDCEEQPVCSYCGKPYKETVLEGMMKIKPDTIYKVWQPNCNCLSELAKQQYREKEEEWERIEEERQEKQKVEQIEAERNRIERIFNNSMITPFFRKKKFENLDMTENLKFCKDYAANFNKETSKGLQFIGDIGTGKTTALACICNQLMEEGHPCLFTTFSALLNKFSNYSYEHAGDILPLLEDLSKFEFVVLDDLGRETYTDKRKEFAFMIVDHLMNYEVVTAITANPNIIAKLAKLEEWQAIFDRLREMCPEEIQFSSKSMRGANG